MFELKLNHISKRHPWHVNMHRCETWWRHQMETFSALLVLCAGNSPVTGQWRGPLTLSLICALSKQSWGWWFETPSRPLWCHCYEKISLWCMINQNMVSILLCISYIKAHLIFVCCWQTAHQIASCVTIHRVQNDWLLKTTISRAEYILL